MVKDELGVEPMVRDEDGSELFGWPFWVGNDVPSGTVD
jgi:hypothetical protein